MTQAAAKCAEVVSLDQRRARKRSPDRPGPPPRKITVLPPVLPERSPPAPKKRARKPQPAYCDANKACVAYPRLNSPAKLSSYNTTRIGDGLYCYGCREKIAEERASDTGQTRGSERAAAARYVARRAPLVKASST